MSPSLLFENTHENVLSACLVNARSGRSTYPYSRVDRAYRQSSCRLDYAELAGRSVSFDTLLKALLLASGGIAGGLQLHSHPQAFAPANIDATPGGLRNLQTTSEIRSEEHHPKGCKAMGRKDIRYGPGCALAWVASAER